MSEQKNTKPIVFTILKIIGFALVVVGIIILISGATKVVPPMGSNGWFEASKSKSMVTFGGIACLMFSVFILSIAFAPSIHKTMIKTKKYIIDENKDDIKDIVDSGAEIASGAITKTVKAVKNGLKEEPTKFCKHCGMKIDDDSKFCNQCGGEQ